MYKYPARYTDSHGSIDTFLFNDHKNLFIELNGICFSGRFFDDFTPVNPYRAEQLQRFSLRPVSVHGNDPAEHIRELCDFRLKVEIPIVFFDTSDNEQRGTLSVVILIDKEGTPTIHSELRINTHVVASSKGVDLESIMERLQNAGNIKFKSCFGCLFSDYWVAGNQTFGDMMCFRNAKAEYLSVKDKGDFMDIAELKSGTVQEIYYCEDYQQRIPGTGYRG